MGLEESINPLNCWLFLLPLTLMICLLLNTLPGNIQQNILPVLQKDMSRYKVICWSLHSKLLVTLGTTGNRAYYCITTCTYGRLGALGACSLRSEMPCWSLALNLSFESESQCRSRSPTLCFICSHMRRAFCSLRIWEGILKLCITLSNSSLFRHAENVILENFLCQLKKTLYWFLF